MKDASAQSNRLKGILTRKRAPAPSPYESSRSRCQLTRKWSVNSAWLAMSARYSNTSSRRRATVTLMVVGSTAADCMRAAAAHSGGADDADGEPALGPVDALAADRLLPPVRAAELADHAAVLVQVGVLPRQRGAP